MKIALLVLGMHRSGTSAVAGALAYAGAAPPRNLLPANSFNERGYFESTPITHLNDEILASLGRYWNDWRSIDPDWVSSPSAAIFRERAVKLLFDEYRDEPLIVVKDPRICRLGKFWLSVLDEAGFSTRVFIPTRNPIEVVHSLSKMHGLSIDDGLLIWLRYMLDIDLATRTAPRSFIAIDDFLADWRGALSKAGEELEIDWTNIDADVVVQIDQFIDQKLKHYNFRDCFPPQTSEWILRVEEAFSILTRNRDSKLAIRELDLVAPEFDRACLLFGPAFTLMQEKIFQDRDDTASLLAQLDALKTERDVLVGQLAERQTA